VVMLSGAACRCLGRVGAAVLLLVPSALILTTGTCRAEETRTPALGVLPPVTVEMQVTVPPEGLWRAPQSSFVRPDTVLVLDARKSPLPRAAAEPRRGEFGLEPGGGVRFSPEDAGRRLFVRYQFSPRRVVLLKTAPPTDYPDAATSLDSALAEELGACGFVVVPTKEVMQAAAAAGMEAAPSQVPPPPEKLVAFAQRVNAAYVLGPAIAIRHFSKEGSVDTGIERPRDKVGEQHPRSPLEEESTIALPVTRHRLSGGVRLIVVDGATGAVITDQVQSSIQKVRLYRFSAARKALVRNLAQQIVAAWRESSRERGTGQ